VSFFFFFISFIGMIAAPQVLFQSSERTISFSKSKILNFTICFFVFCFAVGSDEEGKLSSQRVSRKCRSDRGRGASAEIRAFGRSLF
jgi:hypothetical protein